MKKLMLVVVLLLAVGVWAAATLDLQGIETKVIEFRIQMMGLSWQVIGVDGDPGTGQDWDALGTYTNVWALDGGEGTMYTAGSCFPCDVAHYTFWCENTGGITLDAWAYHEYDYSVRVADQGSWVITDNGGAWTNCVGLAQQGYKCAFRTAPSTGNGDHGFTGGTRIDMFDADGSGNQTIFIDELMAECPGTRGDGTWRAGETDQYDMDVVIVMPPSVDPVTDFSTASQDIQLIQIFLSAKVD